MVRQGKISSKTYLIITVLLSFIVLCESRDNDRHSGELNQRADGDDSNESNKKSMNNKSDSSNTGSGSENDKKSNEKTPENIKKGSNSEIEDVAGSDNHDDIIRSTRGLRADDEPEDGNVRRKRSISRFENRRFGRYHDY